MFVLGLIAVIAAVFAICWVYAVVKEKAKRGVFFREQYEREKAVTRHDLVLTTTAPIQVVQSSLARYLPDDRSARAAFLGDVMQVHLDGPNRIVYDHTPKITTPGEGDRFTASVTFKPFGSGRLRAVVSIDCWREKDGVTRRAGIAAMEKFMTTVVTAFRAVDPAVQVDS